MWGNLFCFPATVKTTHTVLVLPASFSILARKAEAFATPEVVLVGLRRYSKYFFHFWVTCPDLESMDSLGQHICGTLGMSVASSSFKYLKAQPGPLSTWIRNQRSAIIIYWCMQRMLPLHISFKITVILLQMNKQMQTSELSLSSRIATRGC